MPSDEKEGGGDASLSNAIDKTQKPFYLRHPKIHKLFFWLSAWRPVTKYEHAKMAQTIIQLATNVVAENQNIKRNFNNLIFQLARHNIHVTDNPISVEQETSDKKDETHDMGKKDYDGMYR